jgi:hypothetical protein
VQSQKLGSSAPGGAWLLSNTVSLEKGFSLAVYGSYYPITALPGLSADRCAAPQYYGLPKVLGEKMCVRRGQSNKRPACRSRVCGSRGSIPKSTERYSSNDERTCHPRQRCAVELYRRARCRARLPSGLALDANFIGHQAFEPCVPDPIMDTSNSRQSIYRRRNPGAKPKNRWSGLRYREGGKDAGLSR